MDYLKLEGYFFCYLNMSWMFIVLRDPHCLDRQSKLLPIRVFNTLNVQINDDSQKICRKRK